MTQNLPKVKALGRMIDGILRIKLLRLPTANQNLVSTKKTPCYTLINLCRGGGTGRRAGFRNPVPSRECRFDSDPRYQVLVVIEKLDRPLLLIFSGEFNIIRKGILETR